MSGKNGHAIAPDSAVNRLSIAHLLLWITTTAIVLALQSQYLPREGSRAGARVRVQTWQSVIAYTASPAYGVSLAGAVVAIAMLITGRRQFPTQPGHWLLLVVAIVTVAIGAVWLLRVPPEKENWAMAATLLAMSLLTAMAGSMVLEPRRWHIAFVMASAGLAIVALKFFALASGGDEMTLGLGYVFGGAAALAVTLAAALAMTAAAIDWFAADRRDAYHWAGIVVLVIARAHGLTLLAMGLPA